MSEVVIFYSCSLIAFVGLQPQFRGGGVAARSAQLSVEEVLSLVSGASAVFDGVVRTVMIACEAAEAAALVLPFRLHPEAASDVGNGTYVSADAAFHTAAADNPERGIGDEDVFKECAEHPTVGLRPSPFDQPEDVWLPFA